MVFLFAVVVSLCAIVCVDTISLGKNGENSCGIEASAHLVHQHPWLVFLEYFRHDHLTHTRCGGTLINIRHVITAAHCIETPKFNRIIARLGEYDLEAKLECVQGICTSRIVEIEVEHIIVHPEYDGSDHDIAILRLKNDAPYTDFIRPICLPTGVLTTDVTFTAAGWGVIPKIGEFSRVKKIIPLPYVKFDTCQKAYPLTKVPKHVICAGGEEGIDTCSGDSGGPLVFVKKQTELWGVVSAGSFNCGTKGNPGIYTSVKDHLDWVKEVLRM